MKGTTADRMMFQMHVDPLYGSDRYLDIEPEWVTEAEDTVFREFPFRKYPVTRIRLKDGKQYVVDGHHAERIKAARAEAGR